CRHRIWSQERALISGVLVRKAKPSPDLSENGAEGVRLATEETHPVHVQVRGKRVVLAETARQSRERFGVDGPRDEGDDHRGRGGFIAQQAAIAEPRKADRSCS